MVWVDEAADAEVLAAELERHADDFAAGDYHRVAKAFLFAICRTHPATMPPMPGPWRVVAERVAGDDADAMPFVSDHFIVNGRGVCGVIPAAVGGEGPEPQRGARLTCCSCRARVSAWLAVATQQLAEGRAAPGVVTGPSTEEVTADVRPPKRGRRR